MSGSCIRCRSYAINPRLHGRDDTDLDLCDVCYWRARAESNDTLRAQLEAAEAEWREKFEARTIDWSEASNALYVWRHRAKDAEARAEAAEADAQRWREFCRQIDSGDFPHPVWHDAMHMGSGALEMHIDSERVARTKEQQA